MMERDAMIVDKLELSPINLAGVRELLEDYENLGRAISDIEKDPRFNNPLVAELVSGLRDQRKDLGETLTLLGQKKQVASIDLQLARPPQKLAKPHQK